MAKLSTKKPRKNKPGAGRPVIPPAVDVSIIRDLAVIHCTMEEISWMTKLSVDTLERKYAEAIKEGKSFGKRSLRRMQWEKAEEGNVTMMIWLGKQLLGQKDQNKIDVVDETNTNRNDELENQIEQLKEMISAYESRMVKK